MVEKYINPHTDFGFKRLFGSEFNKELLISFLNAMFRGEQNVQDVTYLNSEQLGDRIDARRAVFDVYCTNDKGERFIVEMQNVYQEFFKDHILLHLPHQRTGTEGRRMGLPSQFRIHHRVAELQLRRRTGGCQEMAP